MVNSCLSRLVRQQAEKYGDKVALKYRELHHCYMDSCHMERGLLIW